MGFNNPSAGGLWTLLHDETLADAGTFDVTGIPDTHVDLKLHISNIRSAAAGHVDTCLMWFNGDETGTNYHTALHWAGSSHSSSTNDQPAVFTCPGASAVTTLRAGVFIWIFAYADTTNQRNWYSFSTGRESAASIYGRYFGSLYEVTGTAINRINIVTDGGSDFAAGARLRMWGL